MRRDEVAALALPEGKSDHLIPDDRVPGLALRLRDGGSRTWIFSYRIGRRQRRMTLGPITALSVQEARRLATTLFAKVKLGVDPAQDKEDAKLQAAETVKAKLPLFLARQQDRVRDGKLRQRSYIEIERHLLVHVKRLHAKALGEITRRDVASLLSSLTEKISGERPIACSPHCRVSLRGACARACSTAIRSKAPSVVTRSSASA